MASFAAVMLWGGYRAYRAHLNIVTLNVHDMEVRRVVSKLEWQTWEKIVVSRNVGGRVTLNVHNVPLEEVLNIVGLQTDSRWTRLYPIYSTKKSLSSFNQSVAARTGFAEVFQSSGILGFGCEAAIARSYCSWPRCWPAGPLTAAFPPWQSVQPSCTSPLGCMEGASVAVWQLMQPTLLLCDSSRDWKTGSSGRSCATQVCTAMLAPISAAINRAGSF